MTVYLDTSLVVAALTIEPNSASARHALAEHSERDPMISLWTVTEFSAALAMKMRMGVIDALERSRISSKFAELQSLTWTTLEIRPGHYTDAAMFAGQPGVALRAGDALHIAIAATAGAQLLTMDKGLAAAATALGYSSRLV